MKTKYVLCGICALLAAGGTWFGRAAWRAHRQLVSLDVYNMPLTEVLRKIERQTWRKIRSEEKLSARITLHVVDEPLSATLEQIAEQAGARYSTVFAAYASKKALGTLESALRRDAKIESAGWTKLAPKPANFDPPGSLPSGDGPGPGPIPPGGGRMFMRRVPNGVTVIQDKNGDVEEWSPTELLVESAVKSRMGDKRVDAATEEEAAETAKRINGDWTKFFVFRKSKFGALHGPGPRRGPDGPPDFEQARREPLERFARLTPQQRVERARERRGQMRIEPKD